MFPVYKLTRFDSIIILSFCMFFLEVAAKI